MNQLKGKSLTEIAKMNFVCECGMRHCTEIKEIVIEENAIEKLIPIVRKYLGNSGKILLSMDKNTKIVAGNRVSDLLTMAGYDIKVHCFLGEKELVSCKEAYEELLADTDDHIQLLIAIGNGTLNDLTKYVAFHKNLPFFIVATAPSMDGFASPVAPMIWNGLKYAFPAKGPVAIIADINILKASPLRLRAAGFGDIVGKGISICDWKLSNIILGEAYCQTVADNVLSAMKKCVQNADGLIKGETEAVKRTMEALVLCGLMMSYVDTSRPASGSEHNFSHGVELIQLYREQSLSMHGESVAVGSIVSCVLYEKFKKEHLDYGECEKRIKARSKILWEKKVRSLPVAGTEDMIKMEKEIGKNTPENCLSRLKTAQKEIKEIREIIEKYVPEPKKIIEEIRKVGGVSTPQELGLSREDFQDAVLYAKDMRYRYSLLQLIWDIGKEDEYASEVTDYFYSSL